jgi:hypothetical protein
MTELFSHATCLFVGFIAGVVSGGLCSAFAYVAAQRQRGGR